jgi:hypothetical protein
MDKAIEKLWWAAHDTLVNMREAGWDKDEETGEIHADIQDLADALEATDPTKLPAPRLWVCDECGSSYVQELDWIDPNAEKIIGGNEGAGSSHRWCERCEDHPPSFILIEVYPDGTVKEVK